MKPNPQLFGNIHVMVFAQMTPNGLQHESEGNNLDCIALARFTHTLELGLVYENRS
jgi:hypothetical protein